MKVKYSWELRHEIITFARKNTLNKYTVVYNWWMSRSRSIILPIWYSDTMKLCYPEHRYTEDQVKESVNILNDYFKSKNYDNLTARYEKHWCGGVHDWGWKIVFDFAE